jgi:hypothetical protein
VPLFSISELDGIMSEFLAVGVNQPYRTGYNRYRLDCGDTFDCTDFYKIGSSIHCQQHNHCSRIIWAAVIGRFSVNAD